MVQTIMLLALGFLLATLVSLLLAPVVWRRAARLATKRLKSSLPISLTDFHAEKDQLRADHAIQLRGLEVSLEAAKEKSAQQMVEIGRQKAENMDMAGQIRELRSALSERKSLISVMEQTLNTNVPRMKERMEAELGANIKLSDTVSQLEGTLKKKAHQLEEADRDIKVRETEINKLRHAVSKRSPVGAVFSLGSGVERRTGGRKTGVELALANLAKGEFASEAKDMESLQVENLKLRSVMTRTKAQVAQLKSFEAKEVPVLRQELRKLGAEILRAASVPRVEKSATKPPFPGLKGRGKLPEAKKGKQSLADRLKGVTKLGGEVDA